jgi:hypothetical protein
MPVPTFQNLGFESAGGTPGSALGWLFASQASAEEIAGYAPTPERPQEDFERGWEGNDDFVFVLAPTSVEPALFDSAPKSFESFEQEWSGNESFLFELASIAAADYDPGAGTKLVEDYEGHWASNQAFLFAFTPANLVAAPTESFESGWRSNQTFLFAFAPANLAAADFDPGAGVKLVEDFEALWPTVRMTTL